MGPPRSKSQNMTPAGSWPPPPPPRLLQGVGLVGLGSWSNSLYKFILLLDQREPHLQLSTFRAAPRKLRGVRSGVSSRRPGRNNFSAAWRIAWRGSGERSQKKSGAPAQSPTLFWLKKGVPGCSIGPARAPQSPTPKTESSLLKKYHCRTCYTCATVVFF